MGDVEKRVGIAAPLPAWLLPTGTEDTPSPSAARELIGAATVLEAIVTDNEVAAMWTDFVLRSGATMAEPVVVLWITDAQSAAGALRRATTGATWAMQRGLRRAIEAANGLDAYTAQAPVVVLPLWRPRDRLDPEDFASRIALPGMPTFVDVGATDANWRVIGEKKQ